ncbi:MAG: amidohydrolase [Nakamurella sp.]
MTPSTAIDIHQHLWPAELIEALRARRRPPRLDGWTLLLAGEPPYEVNPADHDPIARRALDEGRIVLGLSSPLGIEDLPADEARPLLAAWHDGAAALGRAPAGGLPGPGFESWAAVSRQDADLGDLKHRLSDGFAGVQIPATWLATPAALDGLAEVLAVADAADKPVFVHPGPVGNQPASREQLPPWWPAVVEYPRQMTAAWWSWHAVGRTLFPRLRICFAAGAGLAPVHHERYLARGGKPLVVDRSTFVDTSSYGRQGVDSLIRVLGVDPIVNGSDRPYGVAFESDQGEAVSTAFRSTNPLRLLEGTRS